MTIVMKIDLVDPHPHGLALKLNKTANYRQIALTTKLSRWLAASFAARDMLMIANATIAIITLLLSILFMRDTTTYVALKQTEQHDTNSAPRLHQTFNNAT